MARPTKLTAELINQLEEHLTLGLSRARACILAGICEDTLANWCKADPDLDLLLQQAEVKGEVEHLKNIRDIANGTKRGDFRSSAWFLSRKYPERWGEHQPSRNDMATCTEQGGQSDYQQKLNELRRKKARIKEESAAHN